jgi:hypothetical protein
LVIGFDAKTVDFLMEHKRLMKIGVTIKFFNYLKLGLFEEKLAYRLFSPV